MPYKTEEINGHLFFEMPRMQSDVGVLFGAGGLSGEVARKGAALYHQRRFPALILTGGVSVFSPMTLMAFLVADQYQQLKGKIRRDFLSAAREADHMRRVLIAEGVPEGAIICTESNSQNTGENVRNIRFYVDKFNSATLVALAPMRRRALGTMRMHWEPRELKLATEAVYPYGIGRDNWHHHPPVKAYVEAEMRKVDPNAAGNYIARGFCVEVDVAAEIANNAARKGGGAASRLPFRPAANRPAPEKQEIPRHP